MEKENLKIDIEILSSYELPVSNQLKKITGDIYSSQFYEDLFHLGGFIVRHNKTGLIIKCTPKEKKPNSSLMTFTEYVNQADPKQLKSGTVKIDPADVNSLQKIGKETYISLLISGRESTYIKKENSQILYTTDPDGNAKNKSVFFLNFNV